MALGQAVITLTIPMDQGIAARLGPGAVAILGYAGRIVILMTGLGAVVFTRASLPVFSPRSRKATIRWAPGMRGNGPYCL